jgi:hypothetical protein
MKKWKTTLSLSAVLGLTLMAWAGGAKIMYATTWSAYAEYQYSKGTVSDSEEMGGDGDVTAELSLSNGNSAGGCAALIQAYPAINASEVTSCTAEVGGVFDDDNIAPITLMMRANASWAYNSLVNNPYYGNGTGGAGIAASDFDIQCLADGFPSIVATVGGAGVGLTTTRSPSGIWSTTGSYTLYDGTVVSVNENSAGISGTSWSTGGGSLTASAWTSKAPLPSKNPDFTVSASTYVDITWF